MADFVYAEGKEFKFRGKPFKHVGAGVSLMYSPEYQIKATLDHLESVGIRHVRFGILNDAYTTDGIISRLRSILRELNKRQMFATIVLASPFLERVWPWESQGGWGAIPGDRQYTSPCHPDPRPPGAPAPEGFYTRHWDYGSGSVRLLDDCWVDWGYQMHYLPFISAVVRAFSDDPAIFAWDVTNEQNVRDTSVMVKALVKFYTKAAEQVKTIDRNHMVTTGLISTDTEWCGMKDEDRDAIYKGKTSDGRQLFDYVVVHEYDYINAHREFDDIWRANFRWNKSVIVEEMGMRTARDNFDVMENYFRKLYDNLTWQENQYGAVDAVMQFAVEVSCQVDGHDWGGGNRDYGPCNQGRLTEYKDLWMRWAAELDHRNGGTDLPLKLVQVLWRGGQRWTRRVPIRADGVPGFTEARGWVPTASASWMSGNTRRYDLPGSGNVLSYVTTAFPNQTMQESVWQAGSGSGSQNFFRTLPVNQDSTPRWGSSGGWSPGSAAVLPATGIIRTQSDWVFPNGRNLRQSLWIDQHGYWRDVPIIGGAPDWQHAGNWSNPLSLENLPGSGDIQMSDNYVFPNRQALQQSFWRGDSGYWRNVPIKADGTPDFANAGNWSSPISITVLPGSGNLEDQGSYFTRF